MSKQNPKVLRIGLLLSDNREYGRGVLRGIADYSKDHPLCHFRVLPPNRQGIGAMIAWRPDGMIVMLNQKRLLPRLLALEVPIIHVCKPQAVENAICVQSDDTAVGRLGAEHLIEAGVLTYGFVGLAEGPYVEVRAAAFQQALQTAGRSCITFHPLGKKPGARERLALAQWLRDCPKPLAIMACNDACGRFVLETARFAGLRSPEEIAVLGVNNEEPLSRLIWPGLSSIALGTEEIGLKAAALLQRLMTGGVVTRTTTLVSPLGVVTRGSTRRLAMEDPIIAKVISKIHESMGGPLSVADLMKGISISRVSLERRFRRCLNRTPLQEIRRVRIAQARALLMATNLPLKAIAQHCGYSASSRLIEAFKQETALTPSRYRLALARQRKDQAEAKA